MLNEDTKDDLLTLLGSIQGGAILGGGLRGAYGLGKGALAHSHYAKQMSSREWQQGSSLLKFMMRHGKQGLLKGMPAGALSGAVAAGLGLGSKYLSD